MCNFFFALGNYKSLPPTSFPTTLPTASPTTSCDDNQLLFDSRVMLDSWAVDLDETHWQLVYVGGGGSETQIFWHTSGGYEILETVSNEVCLPFNQSDCYYWELLDDWGDGLLGTGDGDNYWVIIDGNTLFNGDWDSGSSLRFDFCIGEYFTPAPTISCDDQDSALFTSEITMSSSDIDINATNTKWTLKTVDKGDIIFVQSSNISDMETTVLLNETINIWENAACLTLNFTDGSNGDCYAFEIFNDKGDSGGSYSLTLETNNRFEWQEDGVWINESYQRIDFCLSSVNFLFP